MLGSVAIVAWIPFAYWRLHPILGWAGGVAILALFTYLGVAIEQSGFSHPDDFSLEEVEMRLRDLETCIRNMKR
jgi:hypothetical protein